MNKCNPKRFCKQALATETENTFKKSNCLNKQIKSRIRLARIAKPHGGINVTHYKQLTGKLRMTVSVRCTRLTETKSRLRLVKLAKLHEGINVTHYKQLTAARRLFEFMSCSKVYKQTSTRVTKNAASCLSEFMSCSEFEDSDAIKVNQPNNQVTGKFLQIPLLTLLLN